MSLQQKVEQALEGVRVTYDQGGADRVADAVRAVLLEHESADSVLVRAELGPAGLLVSTAVVVQVAIEVAPDDI